MWPNPQETAALVVFTEEILNGKLHFLCSVWWKVLMTPDRNFKLISLYSITFFYCKISKFPMVFKSANSAKTNWFQNEQTYLLVQSQQWKHQNNMWNLFKVNNKDTRTTSLTLLFTLNRFHILHWCFYCWIWTGSCWLRIYLHIHPWN